MRFDGQAALITGGGSGIGAATAAGYAQRGGRVAVADIDLAAAEGVAEGIRSYGGKAFAIRVDLAVPVEVRRMVEQAHESLGRIDFLHNNGFGLPPELSARRVAPIEALDDAVWSHSLAVGLTAVVAAIKHTLPIMRVQGGGAIVNTASVAGLGGDRGNVSYNTVKAGLINLTRVAALENARHNIRANVICPGMIDTPLLQRGLAARGLATSALAGLPAGRAGSAEEVANAALFLASNLAGYINGAVLTVDGGLSAGVGPPVSG